MPPLPFRRVRGPGAADPGAADPGAVGGNRFSIRSADAAAVRVVLVLLLGACVLTGAAVLRGAEYR